MRKVLIGLLVVTALSCNAASLRDMRFHCAEDTTRIDELLTLGAASGLTDAGALVEFYGNQLLGTPYVAHTLEGEREWLTINIHELDCVSLVETLYALARTTLLGRTSWRDYALRLESVRYRGGVMGDYSSRLHYISDWIVDNHSRGNLEEVTSELPHATVMTKTINFMSAHSDLYPQLKNDSAMLAKIRNFEIGYRMHRIPFVKKSWTNDKSLKAALQPGDFVGLVTSVEGLDVSHMGIIVKDEKGDAYVLDASSVAMVVQVETLPLRKYLERSKKCLGIRVFRMMR